MDRETLLFYLDCIWKGLKSNGLLRQADWLTTFILVINNPNFLLYFLQMQDYRFLSLFISTDPARVMK